MSESFVMNKLHTSKGGFTLIELLVVMLIIGVLISLAMPWYHRAVLKSHFGTVMSSAKAIATAQELYYLQYGSYSATQEHLDVSLPEGAELTVISLSNDADFKFVMAHHSKAPNVRYVVYQHHSPNFPDNIHCEAKADDEDAVWLCEEELAGEKVENGSLSGSGYTAYVLNGSSGSGNFTHAPQIYHDDSHLVVTNGSRCEADSKGGCSDSSFTDSTCVGNSGEGCQNSTFDNSECYGNGSGGGVSSTICGYNSYTNSVCHNDGKDGYVCGRSEYDEGSSCYSNEKGGCGHATFSGSSFCYGKSTTSCDYNTFNNSTCVAENGGCISGTFNDSTCYAKTPGTSSSRACGSGSTYNRSKCYNQSSQMYGCGSSTYDDGSSCYSNSNGGCGGKSTFSGGSECYGNADGACGSNTYSGRSVCHADVKGACNNNTYKDTSYCTGKFCPSGSPRADGTVRTAEGE